MFKYQGMHEPHERGVAWRFRHDVGPRSSASRWYWMVPLLYVLATVVLCWPLVRHLRSGVAGTEGDPLLNAWTLRWVQHSLFVHPSGLYNGNMFAPNPRTLAFSELLLPQAVMTWPIWLVTHDGLLTYNFAILLTYPSCAVAMFALCRAFGAARGAALIAGLCYAFAPFRLDNVAHLQVLSMQWMPCALLATIRLVQRPTWLRGAVVTASVTLVALSSVYYAVIFGTGLSAFLLVEAARQRRQIIRLSGASVLVALGLAAAIVAFVDAPYLTMRDEQGIARSLDEAYDNSARAASYVTTLSGSLLWHRLLPTVGDGASALFPGAFLAIFMLIGLRQLRQPWMMGIFAAGASGFVLSFGPTWGGKDTGWPLPYRLLYQHIILFQGLRGPDRFAALVVLAMAVLAAAGMTTAWGSVARRWSRIEGRAAAITVLVAGLAFIDVAARIGPIVWVDRSSEALAPYHWLATQPDIGVVAEFPVADYEQRTAFYSTFHWQPVLWGHSGFIPTATYQLRGKLAGKNDSPTFETVDLLADMGVRTLIVHRPAYDAGQLADIEARLAQTPDQVSFRGRVGDSDLFAIKPSGVANPFTVQVTYALNPLGNVDRLTGQLLVTNHDAHARMLYTLGRPRVTATLQEITNGHVGRQDVTILLPAIILPGQTAVPFSIRLPSQPGEYAISLTAIRLPAALEKSPANVHIVSLVTLPHLVLEQLHVTSPPLFVAGEPVAMWLTTQSGKTIPVNDTTALDDGTINSSLARIPGGTTQIVAHGKWSGVELWVAPP